MHNVWESPSAYVLYFELPYMPILNETCSLCFAKTSISSVSRRQFNYKLADISLVFITLHSKNWFIFHCVSQVYYVSFMLQYVLHYSPLTTILFTGRTSIQERVHHLLSRRAIEVARQKDLRGLPCHHVPVSRGTRGQAGDGHGRQDTARWSKHGQCLRLVCSNSLFK